jgi:hypothetical protein
MDNIFLQCFFFFWDSVFDIANNNDLFTLIKSNFPQYGRDFMSQQPTGRFCNGKLAYDFAGLSFSNSLVQFFFLKKKIIYLYLSIWGFALTSFTGNQGKEPLHTNWVKLKLSLVGVALRNYLPTSVVEGLVVSL